MVVGALVAGVKQAAEKGEERSNPREKRTSEAKAPLGSAGFMPGLARISHTQ